MAAVPLKKGKVLMPTLVAGVDSSTRSRPQVHVHSAVWRDAL
jgi:hypothetical protein